MKLSITSKTNVLMCSWNNDHGYMAVELGENEEITIVTTEKCIRVKALKHEFFIEEIPFHKNGDIKQPIVL